MIDGLPADASQDQSNCPPDYYRRTNGMLHQIGDKPAVEASNAAQMAKLGEMTKEELVALVERMGHQCGLVAMMTKEETAQAMRDVLAETALKPVVVGVHMKADIQNRMNAIDRWLDRAEGRAKQQIEHTGKDGEALSIRLLAVQERLLKDVTPIVLENENK